MPVPFQSVKLILLMLGLLRVQYMNCYALGVRQVQMQLTPQMFLTGAKFNTLAVEGGLI